MQNNTWNTKKLAYLGILTAAALILSYVESLLPFFAGIPGMKLGLPNAAIVMILYLYGWKEAVLVNAVRIAAAGLLFGSMFGVLFSLCGAVLSLLCMCLAKRSGRFSQVGVSIAGGVSHNAGQILAAIFVVENVRVGYYFFPLAISGTITGLIIGVISGELVKRVGRVLKRQEYMG